MRLARKQSFRYEGLIKIPFKGYFRTFKGTIYLLQRKRFGDNILCFTSKK